MKFNLRRACTALAIAAIAVTSLTSCDDDDPKQTVKQPTNFSLVTLSQYSASGMVLTYRTGETTPLITLTTPLRFDTTAVAKGNRVIIGYDIPDGRPADTSGEIELMSYRTVFNDTIRTATPQIITNWAVAPIEQTQVWRTGNYINAVAFLPMSDPMHYLTLWADEKSISDGECTMYLTLSDPTAAPGSRVDIYSSFNIAPFLRRHPEVNTFKINVASSYGAPVVTYSGLEILPDE